MMLILVVGADVIGIHEASNFKKFNDKLEI